MRLRGRDRREHAAGRVVGELEGVEDRLDAGEVAVGVVVDGALAEVAEPADEVRRVRAGRTRAPAARAASASRPLRNAGRRDALERRDLARRLDEVVVGAVAADEHAQVAGSSGGRRPRAGAARAGTAPGPWSPAWTRRPARRGRRAWRAGSRTSCWRGAAWSAAARARAPAPRSRCPIADAVGSRWRRARTGRRAARRSPSTARDELTRKRVSAPSSSVTSLHEPARAREERVEVLRRLARPPRPCPRTGWRSP